MSKTDVLSLLKPSVDEIINMVLMFPIGDKRREQIWCLISKDAELTSQLLKRLRNCG